MHTVCLLVLLCGVSKHDRTLNATMYTLAMADAAQTENYKHSRPHWGFEERDPLVRPFLALPQPLYYASAGAEVLGTAYLARSLELHGHGKLAKILRFGHIAGNAWGLSYTVTH